MADHAINRIRLALVIAVAILGLLALTPGKIVSPAHAATAKYYPPLLNNWAITTDKATSFDIELDYGGGEWLYYPQISKKTDTIGMVKTYLTLPAGASLVKWHVRLAPPNNGRSGYKKVKYWGPKSPSLNPKQVNTTTWRWSFRGLRNSPKVYGIFTVNWGTATSQCMTVVAHPMYYKRVKKHGRYVKVLKPIPHAPVQTGYSDGCNP